MGLMPLSTSKALLWQTDLVVGMAQWLGMKHRPGPMARDEAQALFWSSIPSEELNGDLKP